MNGPVVEAGKKSADFEGVGSQHRPGKISPFPELAVRATVLDKV
jgi:hypothetical protein